MHIVYHIYDVFVGSYCYIGPQGIVHGTTVSEMANTDQSDWIVIIFFTYFEIDYTFECWEKVLEFKFA